MVISLVLVAVGGGCELAAASRSGSLLAACLRFTTEPLPAAAARPVFCDCIFCCGRVSVVTLSAVDFRGSDVLQLF